MMVSHIPTYVYIIFIALMYLGYKRCFPRIISVRRLVLLPAVFIFLSLHTLAGLFQFDFLNLLLLAFGIALGIGLGFIHVKTRAVRADHQKQLIAIPGDWTMMLLILGIFSFEFFLHYAIAVHLSISQSLLFEPTSVAILGIISGMTIGRSLSYFVKYRQSQHEPLSQN